MQATRMAEPDCPQDATDSDLTLRLVALFVILFVSCFAAMFPTFAKRVHYLRIPPLVFFLGKHFGTGVIIATAFVHLLNKAYKTLADPCLPAEWQSRNWTGILVMVSCLGIFLVEYLATAYVEHIASKPTSTLTKYLPSLPVDGYHDDPDDITAPADTEEALGLGNGDAHSEATPIEEVPQPGDDDFAYWNGYLHEHHAHGRKALSQQKAATQVLSVVVLQGGIMLHSIIIGLTLVVTSGHDFTSLLLAIIFHQLFEGLTLGVRLAALPLTRRSAIPYLLAFVFAITTPLGIAVGLIGRSLHPRGPTALALTGVLSSISAGVLIYSGCVELLAGDFLESHGVRDTTRFRQTCALLALFAGAAAMTIIGFWH